VILHCPSPGTALVTLSRGLILVTHQVNITALTGLRPAPGEMVILGPQGRGTFAVAGRIIISDL
jgi:hypothetical protein